MSEPNAQNEKPKEERRYDPELLKKGYRCDLDQYEMLKRCSDKRDITEWNQWRREHRGEEILLEGANLRRAFLEGANFRDAHLEESNFSLAHLEGSFFHKALLQGASLKNAHLQDVVFPGADMRGTNVIAAIVNGFTSFWKCKVNRYRKDKKFTDFSGVSVNVARIEPSAKQLLEYNVRRKNWEEWYQNENEPIRHGALIFSNKKIRLRTNKILSWLVRKFWEISDYGISTKQVIKTFFAWAVIFAGIYLAWGLIDYHLIGVKDYPGIVSNLFVMEDSQQAVSPWLVPFRAVYFSIVTMTTLGFGDMYANAHGFVRGLFGHLFLALQVILGYVLLGALVTRFAVLFTAGGPAGKFADDKD